LAIESPFAENMQTCRHAQVYCKSMYCSVMEQQKQKYDLAPGWKVIDYKE